MFRGTKCAGLTGSYCAPVLFGEPPAAELPVVDVPVPADTPFDTADVTEVT
jgi:hypothetical protein